MMTKVELHLAAKSLRKIPAYVVDKLNAWVRSVEKYGIREVRRVPGYHDEPLKGERKGQRSIRLTKAYRAIYSERKDGEIELILVEEVNKHEY
jgi:proteic killer suppression protein